MSRLRKWIVVTLSAVILTLSGIAGINFLMDPLWTFDHRLDFNQFQRGRKERQQKSHALYFRSAKYDTLIFGSSRTAYMNQHEWDGATFNYAVSDMQPNEYAAYLDFALHKAAQPVKRVVIGLDFFGALTYAPFISKDPQAVLSPITEPFYRYRLLLSVDALDYSLKNIKNALTERIGTYTYANTKSTVKKNQSADQYARHVENNIGTYLQERYSQTYDERYLSTIRELRRNHPDIRFVVFTTPVSRRHFQALVSRGLYPAYERWIKESVSVFGTLHHFMYCNDLTNNAFDYFQDSNHAFNSTYDCLTDELIGKTPLCPKTDMVITEENLEEKLRVLREMNGR